MFDIFDVEYITGFHFETLDSFPDALFVVVLERFVELFMKKNEESLLNTFETKFDVEFAVIDCDTDGLIKDGFDEKKMEAVIVYN